MIERKISSTVATDDDWLFSTQEIPPPWSTTVITEQRSIIGRKEENRSGNKMKLKDRKIPIIWNPVPHSFR